MKHSELQGKVQPGMQLWRVGDLDMSNVDLDIATQILKDAPRPVTLMFRIPDVLVQHGTGALQVAPVLSRGG